MCGTTIGYHQHLYAMNHISYTFMLLLIWESSHPQIWWCNMRSIWHFKLYVTDLNSTCFCKPRTIYKKNLSWIYDICLIARDESTNSITTKRTQDMPWRNLVYENSRLEMMWYISISLLKQGHKLKRQLATTETHLCLFCSQFYALPINLLPTTTCVGMMCGDVEDE